MEVIRTSSTQVKCYNVIPQLAAGGWNVWHLTALSQGICHMVAGLGEDSPHSHLSMQNRLNVKSALLMSNFTKISTHFWETPKFHEYPFSSSTLLT
jgi:hypothetical protein